MSKFSSSSRSILLIPWVNLPSPPYCAGSVVLPDDIKAKMLKKSRRDAGVILFSPAPFGFFPPTCARGRRRGEREVEGRGRVRGGEGGWERGRGGDKEEGERQRVID